MGWGWRCKYCRFLTVPFKWPPHHQSHSGQRGKGCLHRTLWCLQHMPPHSYAAAGKNGLVEWRSCNLWQHKVLKCAASISEQVKCAVIALPVAFQEMPLNIPRGAFASRPADWLPSRTEMVPGKSRLPFPFGWRLLFSMLPFFSSGSASISCPKESQRAKPGKGLA